MDDMYRMANGTNTLSCRDIIPGECKSLHSILPAHFLQLYVFCGIAAVFGAFWGGVGGVISQFVISLLVGTDDDRYPTDQAVVLSKGKAPLRNRKSSQGIQYVEKEKSTLVEGYSSSDSDLEHADDWNWQEKEENNRL